LREETEWVGTVQCGWNRLVGADRDEIVSAASCLHVPVERPPLFGDGHAAERLVAILDGKQASNGGTVVPEVCEGE
jgi:UDP-GlcNAc3NAcA epimerase